MADKVADKVKNQTVPIGNLPRQSEENQERAKRVYDRFQQMKTGREKQGDKMWDKWDQLYLNEPTSDPPEDWMANVFVPFVMSVELAILAEITDRRPRWKVLPQSKGDEEKTDVIQAITDYTMDKGNWDDEFFKFTHDKIHYGTAVWKEVYREDRRVLREEIKTKDRKKKFKIKDIKEFQDVYGYHVPLRDFYFDDRVVSEGIRGAEDCLERKIMRIGLFRTRFGKYKRSEKVKKWGEIKPELTDEEIKKFPPGGDTSRESSYTPIEPMEDDEVEVLDYWNKLNDEHILVANGVTVVYEPINYDHKQLPYALDAAIPKPQSPYGMGIPQTLEPPQEEINTMHNMMLDEAKLSIHKPTWVGGTSLISEDDYQYRPKMIIPVDDVTQIKQSDVGGPGVESFRMFDEIKQTIRTAAGLDVRFAEATSPSGRGVDTATEIIRLQESSLRRIGLYTKIMEIRALPRIARLRTMNIMQYYSEPLRVEQVLGKENEVIMDEVTGKPKVEKVLRKIRYQEEGKSNFSFMEVDPEKVRAADVDIRVVPQSTQPLSQAVIAKRLNTALQTILSFPPAIEVVDLPELVKQYLKVLDLPISIARDTIKGQENNDLELAGDENDALRKGELIPATTNPSIKHTSIHAAFIYKIDQNGRLLGGFTDTFNGLSPEAKKAFLDHYQGELRQHESKGTIAATGRARGVGRIGGTGTQETVSGEMATQM